MGIIEYTRAQIVEEVRDIIGDASLQLVGAAVMNRTLDRVMRNFVERTTCNRNVVIFSIADGSSSGVLEYDMLGLSNAPTLTRGDMEGWNVYTLNNCLAMDSIDRWITTDDGYRTELDYVNQNGVDARFLLEVGNSAPSEVFMVDKDKFRLYAKNTAFTYPVYLVIVYRVYHDDFITNRDHPVDNATPVFSGVGLDDMTNGTANTAAGTWTVVVTTLGTPDKFKWQYNGGTFSTEVSMTGTAQTLSYGQTITFGATTGHSLAANWNVYRDDLRVPVMPAEYRVGLVYLTVAELAGGGRMSDTGLVQQYQTRGGIIMQEAKDFSAQLIKGKTVNINSRYTPAGL